MTKRTVALVGAVLALAFAVPTAGWAVTGDGPTDGDARRSQAPVDTMDYSDCPRFTFCGWDGMNATSWRMEWSGTIACGQTKDLVSLGWSNRIESIKNNTTATIVLVDKEWGGGGRGWQSPPGNGGNLGGDLSWLWNETDELRRFC